MRPFRSILYMPGSNARALEKARTLPADGLILDMEDAVAPDAKAAARGLIAGALGGFGQRFVLVRCNGLDTDWAADDVAAIAAAGARPDAILVPKVASVADVDRAAALVDAHAGLSGCEIWAMIETPAGVQAAAAIAGAPRIGGFVVGTNDLIKDMRARPDPARTAVAPALVACVLAARAAGIVVIDGVFNDIRDQDGLAAECAQGRTMGFDGKSLIHPAQVAPANAAFGPSAADLEEAHAFVAAYDAAVADGKAVAVVNGRIVENLHVETARRLIAQAQAIAVMEPVQ